MNEDAVLDEVVLNALRNLRLAVAEIGALKRQLEEERKARQALELRLEFQVQRINDIEDKIDWRK